MNGASPSISCRYGRHAEASNPKSCKIASLLTIYKAIFLLIVTFCSISHSADLEITPPNKVETTAPRTIRAPGQWHQSELPGAGPKCEQWTDECKSCQRTGPTTFSCSNVGFACIQKAGVCTLSERAK